MTRAHSVIHAPFLSRSQHFSCCFAFTFRHEKKSCIQILQSVCKLLSGILEELGEWRMKRTRLICCPTGREHTFFHVISHQHLFSHENDLNLMITITLSGLSENYFFQRRISVSKRGGESLSCNLELFKWPSTWGPQVLSQKFYSCLILSLNTIIYWSENSVKNPYQSFQRHGKRMYVVLYQIF